LLLPGLLFLTTSEIMPPQYLDNVQESFLLVVDVQVVNLGNDHPNIFTKVHTMKHDIKCVQYSTELVIPASGQQFIKSMVFFNDWPSAHHAQKLIHHLIVWLPIALTCRICHNARYQDTYRTLLYHYILAITPLFLQALPWTHHYHVTCRICHSARYYCIAVKSSVPQGMFVFSIKRLSGG
jgi:hypothetical protein